MVQTPKARTTVSTRTRDTTSRITSCQNLQRRTPNTDMRRRRAKTLTLRRRERRTNLNRKSTSPSNLQRLTNQLKPRNQPRLKHHLLLNEQLQTNPKSIYNEL